MNKHKSCLLKHMGKSSPINPYRAEMAEDVAELVADGKEADAAWLEVIDDKLGELQTERARIEADMAQAYAKARPAAKVKKAAPEKPAEAARQAVDEQVAAVRGMMGADAPADATHKDPGQPAEPVTQAVVTQAITKAARNEERPRAEMRAELLAMIDAKMADAKPDTDPDVRMYEATAPGVKMTDAQTAEYKRLGQGSARDKYMKRLESERATTHEAAAQNIGFVTFDVPGDGKFKVLNTRSKLEDFRKRVEQSPGFKDQRYREPGMTDASSGGKLAAFSNMVDEGDLQAAVDYAEATGLDPKTAKLSDMLRKRLDKWMRDQEMGAAIAARQEPAAVEPAAEANKTAVEPAAIADAEPQLDLKGFTRVPRGNGAFDLTDGNMRVRVEPMSRGKFQASFGSAKSSPHLQSEQAAVDWAAQYRQDATPSAAPAAAEPVSKTPMVDAHQALFKAVRNGGATPEDFKAIYAQVRDGKAAILAELNLSTKDQLLKDVSGYVRPGTTKTEIMEAIYKGLLNRFALGKDYGPNSYMMGQEKAYEKAKRDAFDALVDGQTAESLAQYAAELKAEFDAAMAKRAERLESIKDPKTLDDFRAFTTYHMREGKTEREVRFMLTPEQRARVDDLYATETRSKRTTAKDEQRTTVRVAGQTVDGDIIATKHTKKGTDLFVVRLAERVSREDYDTLNAGAKRIGGYYSSFRGAGAIPGFQFTTREQAQAFVTLAGGDNTAAVEAAKERRDAFQDDRSQSAVERLTEMADRLEERADESLGRERKANTERRARFAASAEAAAQSDKALAKTMRNIAGAITAGTAKFLDRVRQKAQVELLQTYVRSAKDAEIRAQSESYVDQERRKGEPPTGGTADYAEFPTFTAYRSDLASLGRQLVNVDGTKQMGQSLLKVADDVSEAFAQWAREPGNYLRLSIFTVNGGQRPSFPTADAAERAIARSGFKGKAITFAVKRGEHTILMSPSEAMARGIWNGDGDKRITLTPEFGAELVEKMGRANRRGAKVSVPWQFENAYDRRKSLARMGIETPAEFRAALREFIGLREQAKAPDKVKEMERAMIGRRNDGLDFFPTPEETADAMVAAADIQPGMRVLEPSAGMGHIAERIREASEIEPEVAEVSSARRELLEAKGFNVVGSDFLALTEGGYDRILMNPPFSEGRDIQHVRHAYDLLKPGGRLVALMGESAFTNQNKRATEFRDWLESVGGTEEKLAEGTFNDPSLPVNTGANARMVVIEKGNAEEAKFSRAPQTYGIPMRDAEAVATTVRAMFPKAPPIFVHPEVAAAPAEIKRQVYEAGAENDAEAVYAGGEIHAFANNLESIERALFVIGRHEVRHAGFAAMFGDPRLKNQALLGIALKNPALMAEAKQRMADGREANRSAAIEETLADMPVDRLLALSGIDRLIAKVRQWLRDAAATLRKKGYATLADAVDPKTWTDKDVAAFVMRAENISRVGGGVRVPGGGTMFSEQPNTEPWYSALTRAVKTAAMNAGPASAWKAMAKNWTTTGKAKADEIAWSGLDEWLDMQQGKVTKQAVVDYLDANGVQVSETVLGGPTVEEQTAAAQQRRDRLWAETFATAQWPMMIDGKKWWSDDLAYALMDGDVNFSSLPEGMQQGAKEWVGAYLVAQNPDFAPESPTKYANYQLPGGTNYREVLLTLPAKPSQWEAGWTPEKIRSNRTKFIDDMGFTAAAVDRAIAVADEDGGAGDALRTLDAKVGSGFYEAADKEARDLLRGLVRGAQMKRDEEARTQYKSSHWDQPNILAHIRLNDRTDADGKRVLFVEEIQSDWGQAGKKQGFKSEAKPYVPVSEVPDGYSASWGRDGHQLREEPSGRVIYTTGTGARSTKTDAEVYNEWAKKQHEAAQSKGVPAAPFVGKTDAWVALALKRVVKLAVDGEYDKVAFVTGEQSAERYSLSKQVHSVKWEPYSNGTTLVSVFVPNQNALQLAVDKTGKVESARGPGFSGMEGKGLDDIIGKEVAKRIMEAPKGELAGEGLNIGGEGMKAFYDKIVPAVAKDVLRKLGGGKMGEVAIGEAGAFDKFNGLQDGRIEHVFDTRSAAERWARLDVDREVRPVTSRPQPGFDITDAMKARASGGLPMFSRAPAGDQTQTPEFKRWFGDSKVVDDQGRPLVVYHGTGNDFSTFMPSDMGEYGAGIYVTPDPKGASDYAIYRGRTAPNVMPLYVSIKNPAGPAEAAQIASWRGEEAVRPELIRRGYDGIIDKFSGQIVAFSPNQIKSVTGNRGTFDPASSDIRFSRRTPEQQARSAEKTVEAEKAKLGKALTTGNLRNARLPAGYVVADWLGKSLGQVHWWHKSVGTPYNVAMRQPQFKPVYDAIQTFLNDVSHYAAEAANLAPTILPKLESMRDIFKSPLGAADAKVVAAPVFEGTLGWGRDEDGKPVKMEVLEARAEAMSADEKATLMLQRRMIDPRVLRMWQGLPLEQYEQAINTRYQNEALRPGVVWSDAELRSLFSLTDPQIGLYREFRAATDKSLDDLTVSAMLRVAGKDAQDLRDQVLALADINEAAEVLRDRMFEMAEADPDNADRLNKAGNDIIDIADRVQDLKDRGYAPLSRFGSLTLDVTTPDGERQYFGMFETDRERRRKAREMEANFPDARIEMGTTSEEEFKQFAGVTPETLELFADVLGLTDDKAKDDLFQNYLRKAKANRSGLKRLIHRKGVPGFSEDIGRVLASFVYSNARQTSSNLHVGAAEQAIEDIGQKDGQLKDYAIRLNEYVKNPQEEAQALRSVLFAQFLGGSLASAMVNASQPFMVTFPYLSQYGGVYAAEKQMVKALADVGRNVFPKDKGLTKAMRDAIEDGIVAPQEVFFLQAQASGKGQLKTGDGTAMGWAGAATSNTVSRLALAWGKPFSYAELFNRRLTFIAAYRTAVDQGMPNPAQFARDTIAATQFTYNKGNRPQWARGAVGALLFTFKTYSVSMMELMSRSLKTPEGRRAALVMLAMIVLVAGVDGLPFMEDMEDVIDGFAQRVLDRNWSTKAERNRLIAMGLMAALGDKAGLVAADFVAKGLTGIPGSPIDVSGRLGLHNLIPGTGIFLKKQAYQRDVAELAGPAGSLAQRMFEAAGQALGGDPLKAAVTVAPIAVQNVAKAVEMERSGFYPDTKGAMVVKTTTADAVSKGFGFQPGVVKRTQDVTYEQSRLVGLAKQTEAEIVDAIAKGIVKQDEAAQKAGWERLARWNLKNPETPIKITPQQVLNKARNMTTEKTQRMLKTTPRELRPGVSEAFNREKALQE